MKHFLIVVSKQHPIDSLFKDHIAQCKVEIKILSDFKEEIFATPHVLLYAWSNEGDSNLVQNEYGALAFSGYFSMEPTELVTKLARWYIRRDKLFSQLGGAYVVTWVKKRKEQVEVWNTMTRIVPVYYMETAERIVISTHPLLTQLVAERITKPRYALQHLAGFLNTGYFNNELTPFDGVKLLRPNEKLMVTKAGLKLKPIDGTEAELYQTYPDSAYYDELAQSLIDAFNVLKSIPGKINCAVTGGKDSRLIAAALKYMGVDFTTFTNGFEEHPDVVLGKRVAQALQVPHTVYPPPVQEGSEGQYLEIDLLNRTRDKLRLTCGMISAYENLTVSKTFKNRLVLGGQGGELIRGGYAKNVKRHDLKGLESFIKNTLLAHSDFLKPEVAKRLRDEIQKEMESQLRSIRVVDFLDLYYLYYRCGRWSATARSAYLMGSHVVQPLFDNCFVKKALKSKTEYRLNDRLLYELIKRLAPEVLHVPFFNDRWNFEKDGPVDGDEKAWQARSPLTYSENRKSSFNWRLTCLTDLKQAFYEVIFDSRSEALFQIVDKEKVKGLFEGQNQDAPKVNLFLWHLFTAAVLLSNRWLEDKDESQVVQIKVPH